LALPVLRNRLEQRLALLTGGARDQPSRLQTMRNAIGWSHDLLRPHEQVVFRRLAVFIDGCSLEAAEYVGGVGAEERIENDRFPAPSILDGLSALVDASLLHTEIRSDGTTRYRMMETIREYALERLESSDDVALTRQAHTAYFMGLADRYQLADLLPDGDQAMTLLETEHANFQAVLTYLEAAGESESCMRLVTALGRFWSQQSHYQVGRMWLERVAVPESAAPDDARAKALVHLGMIDFYQGEHPTAETHLTEGLTACRQRGHAFHASLALLGLGASAFIQGDLDRATALLEESLAAAQTIADQRLAGIMVAMALGNLADVPRARGDVVLATAYAEDALRRLRETGHTFGMIIILVTLGDLARDRGDPARAVDLYREALELGREHPGTFIVLEVIQALGIVAVAVGQAERGARLLGATEAQRERIGLRYRVAENQVALEQAEAKARATLGGPAFTAAWSAGRALHPEEVVTEALDPVSPPRQSSPAVLSPREEEVLRLLVSGQTNPAIAKALFISVRTVENHIAHILAKLGVSTRTAAVAAAIAAGLHTPTQPPSS
jgi:DNA-binding CsgD family transcriptional regulator